MTKLLAALLGVLLLASAAAAQSHLDKKVDGSDHYNADMITDLPQGPEEKLYLSLITAEQRSPRDTQVAAWLSTDQRLLHFKGQCHWNWYTSDNPHYREQLRHAVGEATPIVVLQQPDGNVLMKVSAKTMPRTAGELADMINDAVQVRYAPPDFTDLIPPGGSPAIIREGDCGPDGCPTPPSQTPPSGPFVDDVVPKKPLSDSPFGLLLLIVGGIVGGGGLVLIVGLAIGGLIVGLSRGNPQPPEPPRLI